MAKRCLLIGIATLVGGCATASAPPATGTTIRPTEAIIRAAEAAPKHVHGVFGMHVKATGREGGRVYLNSELDYRDQRNLTISIAPGTAAALTRRLGTPPDSFFKGKWIEVRGTAERVRIGFFEKGRPTGLYYYQTHVRVSDPDQIVLAAPPAS